ncbi:uncharacterized protein V1518DRAFT_420374 [Limtongia smithiae]|uniref:uncharacterized protein n=1 Tax=Limtongia smithiae TaxID=1125753 RepID=UPI0034CED7CD
MSGLVSADFLRFANQKYRQQKYAEAAILYTKGFEILKKENKIPTISQLDQRALCYELGRDYQNGLIDARDMISQDNQNAKGYIRAARIHKLTGHEDRAISVCMRGMKAIESVAARQELRLLLSSLVARRKRYEASGKKRSTSDKKRTNKSGSTNAEGNEKKAAALVPAAVDMMRILPYETIEMIFSYLGFKDVVKFQRVSKLWRDTIRANSRLWQVIDFRDYGKGAVVTKMHLQDSLQLARGFVTELYIPALAMMTKTLIGELYCDAVASDSLKILHMYDQMQFFSRKEAILSNEQFLKFANLQHLKMSNENLIVTLAFLSSGRFPNLYSFQAYKSYDKRQRRFADMTVEKLTPLNTLQQLTIDGDNYMLQTEHFWKFINCFPKLQRLCLNHASLEKWGDCTHTTLELAEATPDLRELDLSDTKVLVTPIVSRKCQKLLLSGYYSALHPRMNGEDVEVNVQGYSFPAAMYESLVHLDLSHQNKLDMSMLRSYFSRLQPHRLLRLDLRACPLVSAEYIRSLVRDWHSISVLDLSYNGWLDDATVGALFSFPRLEYLDVSNTPITISGIITLLAGPGPASPLKRESVLAASSRAQVRYRSPIKDVSHARLKMLVMNKCNKISVESSAWIRGLGITVKHDVSENADYTYATWF